MKKYIEFKLNHMDPEVPEPFRTPTTVMFFNGRKVNAHELEIAQVLEHVESQLQAKDSEITALKAEVERLKVEKLDMRHHAEEWEEVASRYEVHIACLREALELVAAPKRPDGTYNRCREACEELARTALSHTRTSAHEKWKAMENVLLASRSLVTGSYTGPDIEYLAEQIVALDAVEREGE